MEGRGTVSVLLDITRFVRPCPTKKKREVLLFLCGIFQERPVWRQKGIKRPEETFDAWNRDKLKIGKLTSHCETIPLSAALCETATFCEGLISKNLRSELTFAYPFWETPICVAVGQDQPYPFTGKTESSLVLMPEACKDKVSDQPQPLFCVRFLLIAVPTFSWC